MTATETFAALEEFLRANPPIDLATVAKPARGQTEPATRSLPLTPRAKAFFRRTTVESIIAGRGAELRPLDLTYKPEPATVEWVALTEVDAVRAACQRYENLNPYPQFDPNDKAYKARLLYWVATRAVGAERAFFYRAFSASAELKRKKGAAIVFRDGPFEILEDQIFLFDDHVDCAVFRDYIFVLRRGDYRRIFEQLEQVRERARQAALALNERVPIANFQDFQDACITQPGMADKLIAIERRDYFDQLSYALLRPVIDEFELDIEVQERDGRPHLVFRSEPTERWRILRLCDDDYLKSVMTEHRYEVNSKTTTG